MCVLHITSKDKSFESFLCKTKLPVYQSHAKGEVHRYRKKRKYGDNSFSCIVSEKKWDDLPGQFIDAIYFLKKHETEISKLMNDYLIDDIRMDFPYECNLYTKNEFMQSEYLPPELLYLAGKLKIGIELSHYASAVWEDNSEQSS